MGGIVSNTLTEINEDNLVINNGSKEITIKFPEVMAPLLNKETVYVINYEVKGFSKEAKLTEISIDEIQSEELKKNQ